MEPGVLLFSKTKKTGNIFEKLGMLLHHIIYNLISTILVT